MDSSPEPRLRFHQRSPLAFGALIIIGLLAVFILVVVFIALTDKDKGSVSASSFSFGQKVAILEVEGEIISSEHVLRQLRSFSENNSVKAVVLRVDSPGGLPAPAQEIYTELKRFEKPVVASMGSLAASGAYYICLPSKYIFASPATLTGSIGVVMETTDIGELLKWAKIKQGVITSGAYKDAGSPFRPMTEKERRYFQGVIDNVYQQFKTAVGESRKIKEPQLTRISDGRIFTGEQAKKLGMIDDLGNIEDAIRKAADLGGIKGEPELIWPTRRYSFWEQLESGFAGAVLGKINQRVSNPIWFVMTVPNLGLEQGASND